MTRRILLWSVAALAVAGGTAPAVALADPPPGPPAPVATPPPVAQPAPGRLRLSIQRTHPGPILTRDLLRVRGVVKPYVPGQVVAVRILRAGHRIATRSAPVTPTAGGRAGMVDVPFATDRPGRLTIIARHRVTPEQAAFRARSLRVRVRAYRARPGSGGRVVRHLQSRLAALGYVVGRRGRYDARTARAVLAFRKVVGMARTFVAEPEVFARLDAGQGGFPLRYPGHGRHVEADLTRQVLVLARGRKVVRIYPISSGKPSTPTVLGSYRVYRKELGTNAHGMVDSSYFVRGYAIHGYASVPAYAASHGCLRVPIPDARAIYDWVHLGERVDVYL
jgi:L,D-transpeptidase catalytic domain